MTPCDRSSASGTLAERSVHVWWIRQCAAHDLVQEAMHGLSDDELARASDYRRRWERDAFVLRRSGLRGMLGRLLDVDPTRIRFGSTASGRPLLVAPEHPDVAFSVAHRSAWAVAAVGRDLDIGVDVERRRSDLPFERLAREVFPVTSRRAVETAHDPEEAFFDAWTRLEATVKMRGDGLATDVDRQRHELAPWTTSLASPPGYVAALATNVRPARVAVREPFT